MLFGATALETLGCETNIGVRSLRCSFTFLLVAGLDFLLGKFLCPVVFNSLGRGVLTFKWPWCPLACAVLFELFEPGVMV